MARTKTEERQLASELKSPKKRSSVRYPFKFPEKRHNQKSLEGRFQSKIQTAVSGTENTVRTDTGKIIHRKFISDLLFQSEKRHRRESAPAVSAEITPKNRHCLRGLDGKYGKWDEILRDILNGKLRIVQNKNTPKQRQKTKMMKKYRKKLERRLKHRRTMDGMLRYKQTPKMISYKYTPMEKCLRVRILK